MWQRARQFLDAGRQPTEDDRALAAKHLAQPLLNLFLAQHPRDVVHAAATARWLLDRGQDDRDLIAAALLHDVGKGEQRRLDRVAFVAAGWLGLEGRLACSDSGFALRRAMARSRAHGELGAAALAAAGATRLVAELTRRHHSPSADDPVLALLQQADAAN